MSDTGCAAIRHAPARLRGHASIRNPLPDRRRLARGARGARGDDDDDQAAPASLPPTDLAGTKWVLSSYVADDEDVDAAAVAALDFGADGSTLNGTTGCNGFGGTFSQDGNTLSIELGPMTLVACTDDDHRPGTAIVDGLPRVASFTASGQLARSTTRAGRSDLRPQHGRPRNVVDGDRCEQRHRRRPVDGADVDDLSRLRERRASAVSPGATSTTPSTRRRAPTGSRSRTSPRRARRAPTRR